MNPEKSISRIKTLSIVLGISISVGALLVFSLDIGLGTALCSLVAVLNFFWLEQVISVLLSKERDRKKIVYILKYLFKFLLIGALLCAIILDRRVSIIGAAIGFTVPVMAIVWVGLVYRKERE